jgi:hypothetical protein
VSAAAHSMGAAFLAATATATFSCRQASVSGSVANGISLKIWIIEGLSPHTSCTTSARLSRGASFANCLSAAVRSPLRTGVIWLARICFRAGTIRESCK